MALNPMELELMFTDQAGEVQEVGQGVAEVPPAFRFARDALAKRIAAGGPSTFNEIMAAENSPGGSAT